MDEAKTGTGGAAKRAWICETELNGAWGQYGRNRFGSLAGVQRSWALQSTGWRDGAPAARARNTVTGEIVAL